MQTSRISESEVPMGVLSEEEMVNEKIYTKAGLVVIGEELEATLGTNLQIFQQIFKDMEYKAFCDLVSFLEKGGECNIDLVSIQEVGGCPFPSTVHSYVNIDLDTLKTEVEPEFQKYIFDKVEVFITKD